MSGPVLATKLFAPRLRSRVVVRARLTERMESTAEARLTLVSAPAGFGKTTAVAAWLAASAAEDRVTAWVSLDEDDALAPTFWTYVVAALQRVAPEVGAGVLPLLESGQPPTRALLTTVLNELGDAPVDVDLVLDDYHLVDGPDVADGMVFLLDHLPPNLRVVITTRADPDLPLARLRARGELVEIRARDLRFTAEEVTRYLDEVGGLTVAPDDVATLADRTEGWAAALQLATLSMQGQDDVGAFVAGFAGNDRYVVDYLVDEVLTRQPDDVRDFLLRTSILERLTGELCDAVTGRSDGRVMLEALDRANLFLIRLDERRHWYRYHHLFADVLTAHLDELHPDEPSTLHRRASDWYAGSGDVVAAVRHALAAGDVDLAADMVEAAAPALSRSRSEATLRGWVDDFPADVVARRPVLALGLVGGLMQHNEFAPAEAMLRLVERWLPAIRTRLGLPVDPTDSEAAGAAPPTAHELVVIDEDALTTVPATVEMYRAALALVHGDPAGTIRQAERALAQAGPENHLARGAAAALSGLACWTGGDLEAAHRWYSSSVVELLGAGHVADVLGCTVTLADLRIAQGRLSDALEAYEEGLRLAGGDGPPLRGASDMQTGIAEIALERGELETAETHLLRAQELGEANGLGQNPYRLRAASAMLAEARGDLPIARDLLVEAQRVYLGDFSPDVRPLHARIARVDVALGDLDAALRWAAEHELVASQELSYAREFELVTFAEVLVARHRHDADATSLDDARTLLERLGAAARAGGRTAIVLDVLVLTALARLAAGDIDAAVNSLREAVELGAVEGHVRVFSRHGSALGPLLQRLVERDGSSAHVDRLRRACGGPLPPASPVPTPGRRAPGQLGLVEPLSARELEVLRLLASDLDGPDIARHLVVSLNTLRTHTKNIYAKLGVNSRRAALRRAHELGLPLVG